MFGAQRRPAQLGRQLMSILDVHLPDIRAQRRPGRALRQLDSRVILVASIVAAKHRSNSKLGISRHSEGRER